MEGKCCDTSLASTGHHPTVKETSGKQKSLERPSPAKVIKLPKLPWWPKGTIWKAELCTNFFSSPRSFAACKVNYPLGKQTSKAISLPKVTSEDRGALPTCYAGSGGRRMMKTRSVPTALLATIVQ